MSRAPTDAPVVGVRDVLVIPTTFVEGDYEQPAGDEPIQLGDDLTLANVRLIVTMTEDESWPGERRRIDAPFLRDHLGAGLDEASYMVAGPPGFAKAVTAELDGSYPR